MPKAGVGTGVVAANACVRSDHAWMVVVCSSLPLAAAGIADAVGSGSVASNDTLSAISLTKSEQSLATRRSRLEPVAVWMRGSRPGSRLGSSRPRVIGALAPSLRNRNRERLRLRGLARLYGLLCIRDGCADC